MTPTGRLSATAGWRRKNGVLTEINDLWLKAAPKDAKREVGQRVNELKSTVTEAVEKSQPGTGKASTQGRASVTGTPDSAADRLDITLPGIRRPLGAEHPVIKTMHEIVSVFRNLGYSVQEGPVIETDYYNFEALNFPPNHPARDTQDTLFIARQESKPQRERLLLRTHTSPVQIRTMEKMKPPIRIVIPGSGSPQRSAGRQPLADVSSGRGLGRGYQHHLLRSQGNPRPRHESVVRIECEDQFSSVVLPVHRTQRGDDGVLFHLRRHGKRGSEPCRPCKQTGWIEILGCGMVDPNVYGFVDYDPKKVSGFAFGMGADRIAILKYGVDDIQLFFNGDVRFLEQFG